MDQGEDGGESGVSELPCELWCRVLELWEARHGSWGGRLALSRVCRTWHDLLWGRMTELDLSLLPAPVVPIALRNVGPALSAVESGELLALDHPPPVSCRPSRLHVSVRRLLQRRHSLAEKARQHLVDYLVGMGGSSSSSTRSLAELKIDDPSAGFAVPALCALNNLVSLSFDIGGLSRIEVRRLFEFVPPSLRELRLHGLGDMSRDPSGKDSPLVEALKLRPAVATRLECLHVCSRIMYDPGLLPQLEQMTALTRLRLDGVETHKGGNERPDWSPLGRLTTSLRRIRIVTSWYASPAARDSGEIIAALLADRPLVRLGIVLPEACARERLAVLADCTTLETLRLGTLDDTAGWVARLPKLRKLVARRTLFVPPPPPSAERSDDRGPIAFSPGRAWFVDLRRLDLGEVSDGSCLDRLCPALPLLHDLAFEPVSDMWPSLAPLRALASARRLVRLRLRLIHAGDEDMLLFVSEVLAVLVAMHIQELRLIASRERYASVMVSAWASQIARGVAPRSLVTVVATVPGATEGAAADAALRDLSAVCASLPRLSRMWLIGSLPRDRSLYTIPPARVLDALRSGCAPRPVMPSLSRACLFEIGDSRDRIS